MNTLDLSQFTGTEGYHRWSPLFPKIVLTDGTKYLAEEAGAYWLMDVIASHTPSVPRTEYFAIAVLTREGVNAPGAVFTLQDDVPPSTIYVEQKIEYTDFPLEVVKLYVIRQDDMWVILLPSEY